MYSTDHNEILHTSWQIHVQNFIVIGWVCLKLEHSKFGQISNSIKILIVGQGPGQHHSRQCLGSLFARSLTALVLSD